MPTETGGRVAGVPAADHGDTEMAWKVGLSRAAITPAIPLIMGGYGGREPVADSKLHDLWVKVLALQAPDGGRGVLISTDLCGLAGEVVVDYALGYRAKYGAATWVHGYAHDMVAHVPSSRVWQEGGYEAGHSSEFNQPAERWSEDVQDRIDAAVDRLVEQVR